MIEFELSEPIKVKGEEMTVLTLQSPKGKHMRALDRVTGDNTKGLEMISQLAGIPASAVDQMAMSDITRLSKEIEALFLSESPSTG